MSLLPCCSNEEDNGDLITNIINLRQVFGQVLFLRTLRLSRQFSGEGRKIPISGQQRKSISSLQKTAEVNQHLISTFHHKNWSLHFIDQRIQGIEHQVVVKKKLTVEIKLADLQLKDGTVVINAKSNQGRLG